MFQTVTVSVTAQSSVIYVYISLKKNTKPSAFYKSHQLVGENKLF